MAIKKKALILIGILSISLVLYIYLADFFTKDKDDLLATGTIEATTVELNARISGAIKSITVRSGDHVKKGQLVAEISRNDLAAQKERDELGVIKAESLLEDLIAGARQEEIQEAAAGVNIAKINYERARDDYERAQTLRQAGAIAQVEYEKSTQAMEINKNQLEAAESRLSILKSGPRTEQVNFARAEVERAKAILKADLALLEDLNIVSPVDGTVQTRNFEEGEYVSMGASLLTVIKEEDLWIKVYIPTDDLPLIRIGQEVKFSISGLDRFFRGVIEEIASQGEYTPKTIQTKKERTNVVFAVKIRVNADEGILKPGMPADVVFPVGRP